MHSTSQKYKSWSTGKRLPGQLQLYSSILRGPISNVCGVFSNTVLHPSSRRPPNTMAKVFVFVISYFCLADYKSAKVLIYNSHLNVDQSMFAGSDKWEWMFYWPTVNLRCPLWTVLSVALWLSIFSHWMIANNSVIMQNTYSCILWEVGKGNIRNRKQSPASCKILKHKLMVLPMDLKLLNFSLREDWPPHFCIWET